MSAEKNLSRAGVFLGVEGLRGLHDAQEFWDERPYGTRLYYGPGGMDYLHRHVLGAALRLLDQVPATLPCCPDCRGTKLNVCCSRNGVFVECLGCDWTQTPDDSAVILAALETYRRNNPEPEAA